MERVLEYALGQFLALGAFFAFPIIQYASLKWFSKKEGQPQLWYLPKYGFRLVIRNKPRKKTLEDIRYRVRVKKVTPPSEGCSISSIVYEELLASNNFFLFPQTDQILLSFDLRGENDGEVRFVQTHKLGKELRDINLKDFHCLICDYTANIKNFLNFNVKVGKRVEIEVSSLYKMWRAIRASDGERRFEVDRIRNVA